MELHQSYIRGARANGAKVETGARVEDIRRRGDRWEVATPSGRHAAPTVVNAAGAWADELAILAGAGPIGLEPKRRTAFTVNTGHETRDWPFVSHEGARHPFYFKPEPGGQLLCSPADETPSEPCDARPVDIDIALAIESINTYTTLGIRSIQASWAGLRSFTRDRDPVIFRDDQVEGFVWMAGLGGAGINTSPATGQIVDALVTGSEWPASLTQLGIEPEHLEPSRSDSSSTQEV